MSEPNDAIVPILRNIQSELAGLKRDVSVLSGKVEAQSEAFETVRTYITYTLGLHSENKVDIETLNQWKKDVDRRLAALEPKRT